MLRKKSKVNTNKYKKKLGLNIVSIKAESKNKGESMDDTCYNSENSTHRKNIMKMSNNIISIMQDKIKRRVRKNNSSQTS
jgi:Fe2+ transport system protein B